MVGYLWVLRAPIISAVILLGLPLVGFWPGARPYLAGLFDPIHDSALVLITAVALFNGWTLVLVTGLILTYGSTRFDLPELSIRFFPVKPWGWVVGACLRPSPWVGLSASHLASKHGLWGLLSYSAGGGLVAIGMLYLSIWIGGAIDRRIARAREESDPSTAARRSQAFLRWLADWPAIGAGFVTRTRTGHFALAPGHGLALGLASSSVMLYVGVGFLTRNIDRSSLSSALAYALLLQLVLTWLLGGFC